MQKRILIAPLDWGLGHATRCIPIVRSLLDRQIDVVLATNGRGYSLLEREFPELPLVRLPRYDVRYHTSNMVLNVGGQMPRILRTIWHERQLMEKLIDQYQLSAIISDNRFGCRSPRVRSIFITHQVHVRVPGELIQRAVNWQNHRMIRRFDECWIPDFERHPGLAGDLCHPPLNMPTCFLGPLSRMTPLKTEEQPYQVIALLSGPEPQRTNLENKIIEQAQTMSLRMLLIQGKTEVKERFSIGPNIDVVSHLTSADLNFTLATAPLIITRSGYSTLMDLASLGKKAILIPTPGQTEQEYLAESLYASGQFYMQTQDALDLRKALAAVEAFPGFERMAGTNQHLEAAIDRLLEATMQKING